jgi:Zn-dependent peptidase ImmA (M78 family)
MAKLYHRPLLTFYMSAPPLRGDRGEDFRTLPDRATTSEPLIDALVRDIRSRQSTVRAILEDEDELSPLGFVGSMSMDDGVGPVLSSIRNTLDLDVTTFRAQGSPEAAFALLRAKVEATGIFVLLIGSLGSHHTAIDSSSFRGFALADPIAPFIVVNDQDAKPAWAFTLLHEVAHVFLGATGVSGSNAGGRLEQFCNDVASAFLLPNEELELVGVGADTDHQNAARLIEAFARERLVSRSLVAYRLFRAGSLSQPAWRSLTEAFKNEWRLSHAARRARDRGKEGGPNYYVVRRHRLGSALLHFVARNMSDGSLTPTRAGKVLGVKPRSVAPLLGDATRSVGLVA